jgi:hypothetical protein
VASLDGNEANALRHMAQQTELWTVHTASPVADMAEQLRLGRRMASTNCPNAPQVCTGEDSMEKAAHDALASAFTSAAITTNSAYQKQVERPPKHPLGSAWQFQNVRAAKCLACSHSPALWLKGLGSRPDVCLGNAIVHSMHDCNN